MERRLLSFASRFVLQRMLSVGYVEYRMTFELREPIDMIAKEQYGDTCTSNL